MLNSKILVRHAKNAHAVIVPIVARVVTAKAVAIEVHAVTAVAVGVIAARAVMAVTARLAQKADVKVATPTSFQHS